MTSQFRRLGGALVATANAAAGLSVGVGPADAAATDVVVNELMFKTISDLDGVDYLELLNTGTTAGDLSGWIFSGTTLSLPAGSTVAAGGYLVVAKDAAQFQTSYGFAPAAAYGGNLSVSGETVAIKDSIAATIGTVSFLGTDPWPVHAGGR